MHARTAGGREVDIVVEAPDGRMAGIEAKAARTVVSGDLAGLMALREAVGDRFVQSVVLYTGESAIPFAPDLWAVPFDALWRAGSRTSWRQATSSSLFSSSDNIAILG